MDQVKVEVLRLVGEKTLEFQEEQFHTWFGKPWQRERDAKGVILCPQCSGSPGFERRGKREKGQLKLGGYSVCRLHGGEDGENQKRVIAESSY